MIADVARFDIPEKCARELIRFYSEVEGTLLNF
jgi:hypothetical protein